MWSDVIQCMFSDYTRIKLELVRDRNLENIQMCKLNNIFILSMGQRRNDKGKQKIV